MKKKNDLATSSPRKKRIASRSGTGKEEGGKSTNKKYDAKERKSIFPIIIGGKGGKASPYCVKGN